MNSLKEKLAIIAATQYVLVEATGELYLTEEQIEAIGKVIVREYKDSVVPGKADGEELIEVLKRILEMTTAEVLAVNV